MGMGSAHHRWKGGTYIKDGYRHVLDHDHSRTDHQGYVLEHLKIAEKALGKPLPPKAVVHHHDRDRSHNENNNLVICEDRTYHFLLHRRMRILAAGGNPDTQKVCSFCQKPKLLQEFYKNKRSPDGFGAACKACSALQSIKRRQPLGVTE